VYTWGRGDDGRLGLGDEIPQVGYYSFLFPVMTVMQTLPKNVQDLSKEKIVAITCKQVSSGAVSGMVI
jgi:hypothetical protein